MKLHNKKKQILSRRLILGNLFSMIFAGLLLAIAMFQCLTFAGLANFTNLSICMVIYCLLCITCWMPLAIPMNQIIDVNEETMSIIPDYGHFKKMQIAWTVLVSNHPETFYRIIQLQDIQKIFFSFDAKWGAYAFQRFSFVLKIKLPNETLKIYLNPMQNGPLMPSGFGEPFIATFSKEDMVNLVEHFKACGVLVEDQYQLINAMKDEKVVLYDYLVSLKKKILY